MQTTMPARRRAKCHDSVSIHPQTLAAGSGVRTVDQVHLSLLDLTVALAVAALLLMAMTGLRR